tara:strand:+ start:680 stop:880 length:201 start_codon:yes stop_codon:yes gene_type:complete
MNMPDLAMENTVPFFSSRAYRASLYPGIRLTEPSASAVVLNLAVFIPSESSTSATSRFVTIAKNAE